MNKFSLILWLLAVYLLRAEPAAIPGKVGDIEISGSEIRETVTKEIKLEDGWRIIKLLDLRESRTPTLDEIRKDLIAQLRAERARISRQEYLAGLFKEHPLAINEIELAKAAAKP